MRKSLALLAGLIILALAITLFLFSGKTYEVRVDNQQIATELNKVFPVSKTYWFIINLTLRDPKVLLLEGTDKVRVNLDVDLEVLDAEVTGSFQVYSGLEYRQQTHGFHLIDPVIEGIEIDGLNPQHKDKVTKSLQTAAGDYLVGKPVYTLTATDTKMALAKLILKKVTIENGELVVLMRIP